MSISLSLFPVRGEIYLPGYMPFSFHHQVNLLNAAMVGIMETFGKMLLQVWLEVLLWLFTLQPEAKTR